MKNIFLTAALLAITFGFAQENKNKVEETVTTKTTVTDSKGVNVASKDVKMTKTQVVDLKNSDANQTNQEIAMSIPEVNTTVSYDSEGSNYMFEKQTEGFRMMKRNAAENTNNEYALLRPSSKKGFYILSQEGQSSFGYFNANGDFVVESYDAKSDSIVQTVYSLQKKGEKMIMKDKM